jgi:uroporphyrin-III C-methyltransferase
MSQEPNTHLPSEIDSDSPRDKQSSRRLKIAFWLSFLSLLAVGFLWLSSIKNIQNLEHDLATKLDIFNEKNQQSLAFAKNADTRSTEIAARAEILEEKYSESFDQQAALKALYLELANNHEERMLSDVEQLLVIANQQLQLAGNIKPALLALQTAEAKLQSFDNQKALQLRKSINQDIQGLQNLPLADITSISLKLVNLSQLVDQLSLVSDQHPSNAQTKTRPDGVNGPLINNPWRKLSQEIWQDIKNMVRIERIDHPEPPLLTPEQAFFLRENVKLHLLTARIALLRQDQVTYKSDLMAAQRTISLYFDGRQTLTQNALDEIKGLTNNTISTELPDIEQSLRLLNQYKLSFVPTSNREPRLRKQP